MTAKVTRVLLVDDDRDVLDSLAMLLRIQVPDCEVLSALRAKEALKLLEQETVSLIITDYLMPDMDGLAFLAELRKRRVVAPRLMITAFPDPDLARKAIEAGAAMVINKPFELDHFLKLVLAFVS